ncbi:hypothetical protein SMA90_26435, partial [Escherichia coli]
MPEKYQSYMRSLMRATAEKTGRDTKLAEQMVNGEKIVSLTTQEAIEAGFSQGRADGISETLDLLGYSDCEIQEYKETWLDKVIGFFLLPLVQGLLLMGMIGGVFFELKTPGVGFPLGLAIVCAIGYFSPLFLEGLIQYWEIAVMMVGVVLLGLEIFVTPGFGVLGILGIVAMATGLTLSMVDNWIFEFKGPFPWNRILGPVAIVMVASLASIIGMLLSVHVL